MKIAIIFPATIGDHEFGGMHRFISMFVQYCVDHGITVVTIFLNCKFSYPCSGKIIELGSIVSKNKILKVFKAFYRCYQVRKIIIQENCDVIYNLFWLMPLFLVKYRKKMVSAIHSNPFSFSLFWRVIVRWIFSKSNTLIVPSESIANLMCCRWGIKNIVAIHNPLDFDMITKKLKENTVDLGGVGPYILSVGRLVPEKNFQLLIMAYTISKARNFVKLFIIGDGELEQDLHALIKKLGLADKVRLLGRQENPFFYMYKSMFFVSSSLTEAFPLVVAEALFCETPVLSVKWLGAEELIRHEANGLLVENDVRELAEGMDRLYFDKKLLHFCEKNTRQSVSQLSLDKIMWQYQNIFDAL